jgi:hypothetical protein
MVSGASEPSMKEVRPAVSRSLANEPMPWALAQSEKDHVEAGGAASSAVPSGEPTAAAAASAGARSAWDTRSAIEYSTAQAFGRRSLRWRHRWTFLRW